MSEPQVWPPTLMQRHARRLDVARDLNAITWGIRGHERREAAGELRQVARDHAATRFGPHTSDRDLCQIAERCAEIMRERIGALSAPMTNDAMCLWLDLQAQELGAAPLKAYLGGLPLGENLAGLLARLGDALWWRRQLRRAVVLQRESMANRAGEVHKHSGQVYVTHDSLARKGLRNAANAAMLEATKIESEDGETITLAQAVAASTSNKALRRGELMTRIRGAEEWATEAGMVGIFTTNTTPSRFHAVHWGGQRNHKHSGDESRPGAGDFGPVQPNLPSDAQAWLCATWARCRAKLARLKLGVFGFRVAEPHHDGTPHWHMLLWCLPEMVGKLRDTMRECWLKESGEEAGAQEHRFKCETIRADRGGAIAYVAKYIAKNIDDAGAVADEGHRDDAYGGEPDGRAVRTDGQRDLFNATAGRVETWASGWRIRQFQAIGQPPVTVWRELRRVKPEAVAEATDQLRAAHAATNRQGEVRASWAGYMQAQGGAMVGRDYQVRILADEQQREGRYGITTQARPIGVFDVARPGDWIRSDRREWKALGAWGARVSSGAGRDVNGRLSPGEELRLLAEAKAARIARSAAVHPWTRVNNCTPQDFATDGAQDLLSMLRANFGTLGSAKPEKSNHGQHREHQRDREPDRSASRAG